RGNGTIGTPELLLDLESERPGVADAVTLGGDCSPLREVDSTRVEHDVPPLATSVSRGEEAALLARECEGIRRSDLHRPTLPGSVGAAADLRPLVEQYVPGPDFHLPCVPTAAGYSKNPRGIGPIRGGAPQRGRVSGC